MAVPWSEKKIIIVSLEPDISAINSLIFFKTPNEWSLYDLENDPLEQKDLFGTGLTLEKELQTKLLDWINRESKY